MPLLEEGQSIRDTYEVERFLGEGAFAEVYRVRHRFLGKQALKVFKVAGLSPSEVQRMLGEAVLLSRLDHPNIVRVFDANTVDIQNQVFGYFTMEYIPGGSLDRFWRSHGSQFVPIPVAVDLVRQTCKGLSAAHNQDPPIIHRDVKPQNILVGYQPDGLRAKISDFGLAKEVNPLTLMATSRGTRAFKAPEAIADMRGDSCAGDVWALGMTLYLLLTDKMPFNVSEDFGALDAAFKEPPSPPSRTNPLCDTSLDRLVLRSLAFDPKNRYRSATEMLLDLESWVPKLQNDPVQAGSSLWSTSKDVLGNRPSTGSKDPRLVARKAVELAQNPATLGEAADLMEEVFNKLPELRAEYQGRVTLWRRGISL